MQEAIEIEDEFYLNPFLQSNILQKVTQDMYIRKIKFICENFYENIIKINYFIKDPYTFLEKLNKYSENTKGRIEGENISLHTKKGFINPIISIFSHNNDLIKQNKKIYEQWIEVKNIIQKPIDTLYNSNIPSNRQQNGYIPFEELIIIKDKLTNGSHEQLLLAMYTMIPPVRSNYYTTQIFYTKPNNHIDDNYILISDQENYISLEKYKTSKYYGNIVIDIPKDLLNIIKNSLEIHPREYLFVAKNKNKYSNEGTFNTWANRTLKKITHNEHITLTMLRHIYISRRDIEVETMSGIDRNDIAKIMGHSIEQQRKYLWHTWLRNVDDN
jgi:hypothetical protein